MLQFSVIPITILENIDLNLQYVNNKWSGTAITFSNNKYRLLTVNIHSCFMITIKVCQFVCVCLWLYYVSAPVAWSSAKTNVPVLIKFSILERSKNFSSKSSFIVNFFILTAHNSLKKENKTIGYTNQTIYKLKLYCVLCYHSNILIYLFLIYTYIFRDELYNFTL